MKPHAMMPFIAAGLVASTLLDGAIAAETKKEPPAPPDKVQALDPLLLDLSQRQKEVPVILVLTEQPQHAIAKEIRSKYEQVLANLAQQVRDIYGRYSPEVSLQSQDEEAAHAKMMAAQLPRNLQEQIKDLNQRREALTRRMRSEIARASGDAVAPSQARVMALVEKMGGKISERTAVINTLAASVPSYLVKELATRREIAEVVYDAPGKPELDNQADSLGADTWWNSGYTGWPWDVGVLDSGVAETHPAISGHTFYENYATNGSHGSGVACMYGSTNNTYRGLAYGLDAIIVDNAGNTSTSMSGADWMIRLAGDDPEVINYSWGNGAATGSDWHAFSRFVDAVVHDYNTSWVKSAGNNGWGTNTMTVPANNYNALTVANMYDQNTLSRNDDRVWTSSSRGPTVNGRKKPDLAAPGHQTRTCNTGSGWTTMGGTSSAAPKVGAATLLLNDAGNWEPMAIKAVLLNTADAWEDNNTQTTADDGPVSGSEWNKSYGWGYLDLWHAHFHRNDYFKSSVKPSGQSGDYKLYKGYAYNNDKATLVWEREVDYKNAATPTAYRDLSDLDLKIYRESNNSTMDSDISIRNNVHQVAANTSGSAVVKVYAYSSSFDGASSEPYALATEENFSPATGPKFTIGINSPAALFSNQLFAVTANVNNSGDLDAHSVKVTLNLPSGFILISGSKTQNVGKITDGNSDSATWLVRAPNLWWWPYPLSYTLKVATSSYSYGETFKGNKNKAITVN